MTRTYGDFRGELAENFWGRDDHWEPYDLMEAFDAAQKALRELFLTRHQVYGPDNIRLAGMEGIVVHILDKWARLKGIVLEKRDDQGETLEDSLADVAVYAIIGLMLHRGEWDLPCVERGERTTHAVKLEPTGMGDEWRIPADLEGAEVYRTTQTFSKAPNQAFHDLEADALPDNCAKYCDDCGSQHVVTDYANLCLRCAVYDDRRKRPLPDNRAEYCEVCGDLILASAMQNHIESEHTPHSPDNYRKTNDNPALAASSAAFADNVRAELRKIHKPGQAPKKIGSQ